jgi:hypothetical protein
MPIPSQYVKYSKEMKDKAEQEKLGLVTVQINGQHIKRYTWEMQGYFDPEQMTEIQSLVDQIHAVCDRRKSK